MRSSLGILFLALALASCQDVHRMKKPENLIPKNKMADVLLEMSLVQGAKSTNRTEFEQTGLEPQTYIWEKFNIDSLQFVESNNYYSENYDEYQDIYLEVQTRLEALQTVYDSLRELEERRMDSIKALDPQDSIEQAREEKYRDSILNLPGELGSLPPTPVSFEDSIP